MKQTLNLAILSIVQIILGLLSNVIIIRFYGIGRETDLFISAQALPLVISNIVTTSLNSVWLGTLSEQRESKLKWHYILSKSLGQALILSILISSVFLIFLKPINQLIFGGIENIENSNINIYSVLFLFGMIFNILSSQLVNALRTKNQFYKIELINIIVSFLFLFGIFLFYKKFNLIQVTIILCLKYLLILIFQLKYLNWPIISIKKGFLDKHAWKLMRPVFSGTIIYKFTPLIDRYFLSFCAPGIITLFSTAQTVMASLIQVIEKSIVIPTISNFGYFLNKKKFIQLKKTITNTLLKITVIVIILLIIEISFKHYFIVLLSNIFNLSSNYSEILLITTILLIGYLHSSTTASVSVAALYAFKETRIPMLNGFIGFIVGIILKFILFQYYSVYGLVIGISLHYILNFYLNTKSLFTRKEFKYEN